MVAIFRIKNLELRIKLLLALFFILIALFLPNSVHAQASTPSTVAVPSTVAPTSPIYTDLLVYNLFHTFSCLSVGSSVIGHPCLTYQITKNAQGAIQSVPVLSQVNLQGGALGATTSLIGLLYTNPPVRTADYLASVGQGFGFVKEAKAQVIGSGAQVLNPILSLWQVSRNISYVFMIIIFVVIGLMVMFRNRINPQTVITAQAALPGLIIGLILITFSYFLAALLSDAAFIGTNLVGSFFSAAQPPPPPGTSSPPTNLVDAAKSENVLSIFSRFVGIVDQGNASSALSAIWDNLDAGVQAWLRVIAGAIAFQYTYQSSQVALLIPAIGQGIQAGLATLGAVAAATNPTGTLSLLLQFVAMLILMYSMFRLLLRLINNFLSIIFLTISAPFHFLAASLPGRQGIATTWILNMLCNILAFPAVLAVFYFVAYLLGSVNPQASYPPFVISSSISIGGNATFPLFGRLNLQFINLLLAFGALVASPSIPDIICRTIGRIGVAGQLIGQEVGGGIGAGRGYSGQFQQGLSGIGERGGGLYTKTGYQTFYNPTSQKYETMQTQTPGQLTVARRKLGGFWSRLRGNRAP